jgi:O-antigen/teichoic acid export membrane protein
MHGESRAAVRGGLLIHMVASPTSVPLRRQAVWVVGCRIIGIGATLASNIVAARLLGPAQFGAFLLVTTVIALGSLLAMAGLNEAGLRFIAESLALGNSAQAEAYLRRTLTIAAITSTAAAVVVTGGLVAVWAFTEHPAQPVTLLLIVAAGIALLAWQQLGAELIRAHGDLRLASLFSGGQAGGPASNLLFLMGLGGMALLTTQLDATRSIGIAVASLCLTCPLLYFGLWRTSRRRGARHATEARLSSLQGRELLTVGGVLLLNQLLAFATQQLDLWLAGGLLTQEALGLYGAAKRSLLLAAMPVQMAMLTIVSTIPWLHVQARTAELERVLRSAATLAAIPSLVALCALTIFPAQVLGIVFGASYSGAKTSLVVMSLGHLILVLSGNPQHVLSLTGRHRLVLVVNLASAAVLAIVGVVAGRAFGAPGLAAGAAISLALQNGVLWWLARRELGIWTHVGVLGTDLHAPVPPCETAVHSDVHTPPVAAVPEHVSPAAVCHR